MDPAGRNRTAPSTGPDDTDPAADPEVLRAVLRVSQRIDLSEQMRDVLESAHGWTGSSAGFMFSPGEEKKLLFVAVHTVPGDYPHPEPPSSLDPSRVGTLTKLEIFEGLGPFPEAGLVWPGAPPTRSLAAPLKGLTDEILGILLLVDPRDDDPAATGRIQGMLELSRPALANAVQVRGIRDLVIKDDTAECFNRRYFEDFLPEELSRASRFRTPMSLIFFDMDNLKEVNSRLGHAMGSRTLHEVSLRVRSKVRKFDKLFRFGGDEFCIVLPETEWHGALEVAERVREAIAGRELLIRERGEGNGVSMTASFGIASFPLHARTKEELIQRADRAMQRVKNGTKNSIGIAESQPDHGA